MRYIILILMVLSLTSCISNSSSSINAMIGVPEMVIDGDVKPHSIIGVATAKNKPTVPTGSEEYGSVYNEPTKSTSIHDFDSE